MNHMQETVLHFPAPDIGNTVHSASRVLLTNADFQQRALLQKHPMYDCQLATIQLSQLR